jgi:dTMP kinase
MDAVGKSSAAAVLRRELQTQGHKVSSYREPGGTPFGEALRGILLSSENITALTQFYLFQAARVELMQVLIGDPSDFIVMDRFWPSTWAYQVQGSGVSQELYWQAQHQIEVILKGHLETDIFFLVIPEALRLQRLSQTGKAVDRYEGKDAAFQTRVAKGYENLQGAMPRKCIDATKPLEAVVQEILSKLR